MSLNLTSMIDIVFLLLIFFILTMTFVRPREWLPTNVRVPGAVDAPIEVQPLPPDEPIVIDLVWLNAAPMWTLAGRTLDNFDEVAATLRALGELDNSLRVILDIEGEVPLGHGIDLYDACRLAGFTNIQFAAEVPSEGGS